MNLCQRITTGYEEMAHKCDRYPIPDNWIKANCMSFYYTDEQILAAANVEAVPNYVQGIYFLICDDKIMYVGQSKHIIHRIDQHVDSGKLFHKLAWFEAPALYLTEIEMYYIDRINPPWNDRRLPRISFQKYITKKLKEATA